MATWKVIEGYTYWLDKNRKKFYRSGVIFEATREQVYPQRHKVVEVKPIENPSTEMLPRRRGRPPLKKTQVESAPEDRSLIDALTD